ncbi:unnamed protein product [Discosporangium mesarthrocarpum]
MSDSHDKVIKNVVILVAMEAEANPMIKHLGLTEKTDQFPPKAPSKCFSGTYKESTVHVVTNGKCRRFGVDNIGTDSATLSTWLALEARTETNDPRFTRLHSGSIFRTLSPDLMINAGTAGGFMKHGTSIGDVFLSSKVCNHDRRIPIPGFNEFGIGNHVAVPTPGLQEALSCQAGVVTTGNSFDHTEMDDKMMDGNGERDG